MDWNNWIPTQKATLCFIIEGTRVLLIRKLRGLGAGKINGPGGKIEPGETALACAIRETEEEIGITPLSPVPMVDLSFDFADGFKLHCVVFVAHGHTGTLISTDEAIPFWCEIAEIPYEEMWRDDIHWLPKMLDGAKLRGRFEFDGEIMRSHDLEPWEGL